MAKKKTKGAGNADDADDRKVHEQPLQAVLLAEDWQGSSFDTNRALRFQFHPLCLDRPKVLCPLLNTTMIEYSINFLETQGVQELYVVCASEMVEDYLKLVEKQVHHGIKITVIRDTTVTNAGDALRELDKINVIQSDPFVLLHGDIVTNCNLKSAIAAHKERHTSDSSAILTIVLKSVGATAPKSGMFSQLRSTTEDLVVGIDPGQDNRILLYDENELNKSVALPCSFFSSHCSTMEIRTDLLDAGLDLCSPDVLARFSDEFDYRDIRREFVANSCAEEEEGLQNKLYAHILPESSYVARVSDVRTYHAVSQDVLRRYCYPIFPDNPSHAESPCYTMQRHFLYHETTGKTRVGRSSVVTGPGMIGKNCFVGENCNIQACIVADFCHIADKCELVECHLWEGVQVEEGAVVQQSILAAGVVIKAGAVVSKGCIIGAGCIVGANIRLPEYTRLTCAVEKSDDDFDDDDWSSSSDDGTADSTKRAHDYGIPQETCHTTVVGADGLGRVWLPADEEDDEDEDDEEIVPLADVLNSQCIGFNPKTIYAERNKYQKENDSTVADNEKVDDTAMDSMQDAFEDKDAEFAGDPLSSVDESLIIGRQEGVDVVKELKLICLEFESGTSPIENLAIELNSYKFSQNATYSDCTMAATLALLEKMKITKSMTDGKLVAAFKSSLDQWAPLLQKMSIGIDEEKAIVMALEYCAVDDIDAVAVERSQVLSSGMSFRLLLQMLHDEEIVSEEAVWAWATVHNEAEGDENTARGKLFRLPPVQQFLEWLDEESDDDDDSEESEE